MTSTTRHMGQLSEEKEEVREGKEVRAAKETRKGVLKGKRNQNTVMVSYVVKLLHLAFVALTVVDRTWRRQRLSRKRRYPQRRIHITNFILSPIQVATKLAFRDKLCAHQIAGTGFGQDCCRL